MAPIGWLYSSAMLTAHHPPPRERRYAGIAFTVLVHAVLLLGWQMGRQRPVQDAGPEPVRTRIQWIRLPAPPASPAVRAAPLPPPAPRRMPADGAPAARPVASTAAIAAAPAPATAVARTPPTSAAPAGTPPAASQAAPSAAEILQRARRDIGAIDRGMRKENNPYLVAPPDSPAIRMRKGMEAAHDMAPPTLWEAPKIEALVNDTGDGARRERVITGNGTYCVTDRGVNTSIDMIEKHGKQRITSCPQHELPASKQEWRTARD
jgi:hypothetical protein